MVHECILAPKHMLVHGCHRQSLRLAFFLLATIDHGFFLYCCVLELLGKTFAEEDVFAGEHICWGRHLLARGRHRPSRGRHCCGRFSVEGICSACVHALAWVRTFAAEDTCVPLEDISFGRFPVEDIALHVCMLLLGRRTHLLQKTISYPVEGICCGTFSVEGICSAFEHAVA